MATMTLSLSEAMADTEAYVDQVLVQPHELADADIAADVCDAIARQSSGTMGIRVDVDKGIVTLHGLVLTYVERQQAEKAAWSARGVRDVVNKTVATR